MPRKIQPIEDRFWPKVSKSSGCWNWTANRLRSKDGTKRYGLIGGGGRKGGTLYAHRVSWEIHNGAIPEGMCVCHSCDNTACVNPKHLFLGTHKQNMEDMSRKGRSVGKTGPKSGTTAKLSRKEVQEMQKRYTNGETQSGLAAEYSVSTATVSNYVTGRTALPNF